jgi:WhiB family transcriptional regulator, redox-sensing transcriptional regulator
MTERRFRHDPDEMWWLPQAACTGRDPELFFPVGTSAPALHQISTAKAVCRGCAVRLDCLEWSLATCQDAGVWGGLDEEERRVIRRARRRALAASAAAGTAPELDDELAATG